MTTHAHSVPAQTIWQNIRAEAEAIKAKEPVLAAFVQHNILEEDSILPALAKILSSKLSTVEITAKSLHGIFMEAYQAAPGLEEAALEDLASAMKNDPAARDHVTPLLFFKGYHALQSYRVAHWLWKQGRQHLALHLQNRMSDIYGVDIHPAAAIGHGVMLDHATGVVIGETAVVGNNVLFWHGVTLGGRSLKGGDRHPKVRDNVMLGANSTLLGPIEIGTNARVAAGSVVIESVDPGVTVAGVPAKPPKST